MVYAGYCESPIYGHPCKFAENAMGRQVTMELVVLVLFRAFNKIEFSIDRCFQKCFISINTS